jgi:hypothetical protein
MADWLIADAIATAHTQIATVFSGTLFASRKMPLRSYLMATAIFVHEVTKASQCWRCRDLGTTYKTSFVLAHKIHETPTPARFSSALRNRLARIPHSRSRSVIAIPLSTANSCGK